MAACGTDPSGLQLPVVLSFSEQLHYDGNPTPGKGMLLEVTGKGGEDFGWHFQAKLNPKDGLNSGSCPFIWLCISPEDSFSVPQSAFCTGH